MACTSKILPALGKRANWECTGRDLIILMWSSHNGRRVPVVCPRDRLRDVMRQPEASGYDRPVPLLVEMDHLHLILPDPPVPLFRRLLNWMWG